MGVFPIRLHFCSIFKRLVEVYPTVTDSPEKVLTSNKIKKVK